MSTEKSGPIYVVAGGGSGGHLTPLVSVASALKTKSSQAHIAYIGQRGEHLHDIVSHSSIDAHYSIFAGKFRRYHGEGLKQLFDIKTLYFNIRDFFRFLIGCVQAIFLLRRIRPDAIFLKGGFVCVPIGYAARLLKIPYITHDSDAIAGLANRLTAKNARYNATALPGQHYPYEKSKIRHVGIPLQPEFQFVTPEMQSHAKKALGHKQSDKLLFCVGGGLGAQRVNKAIIALADDLLSEKENLYIYHISGKKLYKEAREGYEQSVSKKNLERINVIDFTTKLWEYSTAADIVITRAGATNLAEFAIQGKSCIVIPNPLLTGGQQLHNAKVLESSKAALIVYENDLDKLLKSINHLLSLSDKELKLFGERLHELFMDNASAKIADLLIEIAEEK